MLVAHAGHSLLYTSPIAIGLLVFALLSWRSARGGRDRGVAPKRDDGDDV